MDLDAAATELSPAWQAAATSTLVSHGACCVQARAWLLASARSFDFARSDRATFSAPRWLTRRYVWGPTRWPISWCEAVKAKTIDCGVFAVFAREIFRAKGIEAYGGQVIRSYDAASLAHWRAKWARHPEAFPWIGEDQVFHEIVVVRSGRDTARIYDPTDGIWLDSGTFSGHYGHVAIRGDNPIPLDWGATRLRRGQWTALGRAPRLDA